MSIDLVFKIAAIGILTAILNQMMSNYKRDDIATVITLGGLILVLLMIIPVIGDLFSSIRSVFGLY
ncbi:MAG: stage III sporulation protein AC [Eubacteriales bacterium]|jgi:stage III sporulation protein AC